MSPDTIAADKLLTVREAAAYCGVHPKTVRKWIAAGLLKAIRRGPRGPGRRRRRVLVRAGDLDG